MRVGSSFGLVLFAALLVGLLAFSIYVAQPYISDTDPASYVIVPMLMLPVFALLMLKHSEDMAPKADRRSVLLGLVLFCIFLVLVLNLRGYLGPLFLTYGMEMLLMPIAIIALACLIFGVASLDRFAWISIYALFASPMLLLPVVQLNLGFASLNSELIYYIAGAFLHGASFSAPITIYFNGYAVSIGNACVGVGAMIGIVMFLLPVAYFLEGRPRDKAVWVLSGLVAMIVLNFLRMLIITAAWFAYGPSDTIVNAHSIAGQLIFYGVVLAMLLLAGRYRLAYPRIYISRTRREYSTAGICIAAVFSLIYLLLSASYVGAAYIPIGQLSQNASLDQNSAGSLYGTYISYQGNSYSIIGTGNRSLAIVMLNSTNSSRIIALFGDENSSIDQYLSRYPSTIGWKEYVNRGRISYVYELDNGTVVFAYRSLVPYQQGQSYYMMDMYVVEPEYNQSVGTGCQSAYDAAYGLAANLAALNPSTFSSSMDMGYCMISEVVR